MSAWSDLEPVGGNAPKVGIHCAMRAYRGKTWSLVLRIYPDVAEEFTLRGDECYRVAVPGGDSYDRLRLIQDRLGPYQSKESRRGSAINLAISGLEPVDGAAWSQATIDWKRAEGHFIEITLPKKVRRVRGRS